MSRSDLPDTTLRPHLKPEGFEVEVSCPAGKPIERELLSQLEELDDTIFSALGGDAAALDEAATTWRRMQSQAPSRLIDESREQYLRQAENVWRRSQANPTADLARSFAALEILTLLAE